MMPNAHKDHIISAWLQHLSKITELEPPSLPASTAAFDEVLRATISPLPTQGLQLRCNILRGGRRGIYPRCIEVCKAPIRDKGQQLTFSSSWNCSHGSIGFMPKTMTSLWRTARIRRSKWSFPPHFGNAKTGTALLRARQTGDKLTRGECTTTA